MLYLLAPTIRKELLDAVTPERFGIIETFDYSQVQVDCALAELGIMPDHPVMVHSKTKYKELLCAQHVNKGMPLNQVSSIFHLLVK